MRVTVKKQLMNNNKIKGLVVSPAAPRVTDGIYWGYQVRYADSFRKILHGNSFIRIIYIGSIDLFQKKISIGIVQNAHSTVVMI